MLTHLGGQSKGAAPAASSGAPAAPGQDGGHDGGEEATRRFYNKETGHFEEGKERKERDEVNPKS